MDAKAAARASFQRDRARHSSRKQKTPQTKNQQHKSADDSHRDPNKKNLDLPSNWSRYDEDQEEEAKPDERLSEFPSVKSKGANYKDLLAEKSMLKGPDLASQRKNLMVRRGQDLWSRFIDMDNLWSTPHVSAMEDNFFTLDLDFLNKEVEKVDIAERLLVDAKYIPLEEREKSQHSSKALAEKDEEILNPDVVTFDNVDTNQYPSSAPLRMVNNSPNTVSSDSGVKRESNFSMGFHEETQNDTEIHADSFHTRSFGSDRHAAKEAFVQSQSARDTFDAESAEAELDALLDIIDNKSAGKTFDSRLVEPDASPRSSVVAPTESYTRILQGKGSASISVHTLHTAQAEILIQTKASENTFHNMVEATKLPVSLGDGSSQLSVVESTRSVPKANVDQDFDEWLDSL